jgi:hypothetical protein
METMSLQQHQSQLALMEAIKLPQQQRQAPLMGAIKLQQQQSQLALMEAIKLPQQQRPAPLMKAINSQQHQSQVSLSLKQHQIQVALVATVKCQQQLLRAPMTPFQQMISHRTTTRVSIFRWFRIILNVTLIDLTEIGFFMRRMISWDSSFLSFIPIQVVHSQMKIPFSRISSFIAIGTDIIGRIAMVINNPDRFILGLHVSFSILNISISKHFVVFILCL